MGMGEVVASESLLYQLTIANSVFLYIVHKIVLGLVPVEE